MIQRDAIDQRIKAIHTLRAGFIHAAARYLPTTDTPAPSPYAAQLIRESAFRPGNTARRAYVLDQLLDECAAYGELMQGYSPARTLNEQLRADLSAPEWINDPKPSRAEQIRLDREAQAAFDAEYARAKRP